MEKTVTGDPWFDTRSQICSVGREVNVRSEELLINLLEIRTKRTLASITYIGTLNRAFVLTLRDADFKVVDTSRLKELLFFDSICRGERFYLPAAEG
jgi:hypothetical protein